MRNSLLQADRSPKGIWPAHASGWAGFLIAAGLLSVLVSIIAALSLLAGVFGFKSVIVGVLYVCAVIGLIALTTGYGQAWTIWLIRLIGPIPAAALLWWGLGAFGV